MPRAKSMQFYNAIRLDPPRWHLPSEPRHLELGLRVKSGSNPACIPLLWRLYQRVITLRRRATVPGSHVQLYTSYVPLKTYWRPSWGVTCATCSQAFRGSVEGEVRVKPSMHPTTLAALPARDNPSTTCHCPWLSHSTVYELRAVGDLLETLLRSAGG